MTSHYVIVSIICPEVGNGEYIILLKFGGRSVSGFEDIEGVLPSVPFGRGNRVNIILCIFSCFPSCNDMMTFFSVCLISRQHLTNGWPHGIMKMTN